MKYRKKPLEIDALQYTENNIDDIIDFTGALNADARVTYATLTMPTFQFTIKLNDFVIKDEKGVVYIMTPNTFNATYELVTENFAEEDL